MSMVTRPRILEVGEPGMKGSAIVGREINLKYSDGRRYDAVVVRYYRGDDEYKLVYPDDEGVEVASLEGREWYLLEKRPSTTERPVLVGAIIEFVYPKDQERYKAMIYHHSSDGEQLKVCYLDEHSTDAIGGRGWDFVTDSPCAAPVASTQSWPREKVSDKPKHNDGEDKVFTEVKSAYRATGMSPPGTTKKNHVASGLEIKRGKIAKRKPWLK